jgi:hypothetical protein
MVEDLAVPAILASLRAGRSWIAKSAWVDLSFSVAVDGATAEIGQHLHTSGGSVTAVATVRDVTAGDPKSDVEPFSGDRALALQLPD